MVVQAKVQMPKEPETSDVASPEQVISTDTDELSINDEGKEKTSE